VSGKVYSVSSYISMHPGGSGAIAKNCGKDASQGFMTQGGRGSHSQYAYELLGTFLLGALGAPVPK
jgi:cytochrome b involved in lipid metabolism